MTTILKYFFQGLLVFIPIGITVLLFFKLFQFFESLFSFAGFTSSSVLNTLISVAILIAFIILLGLLASSFMFKQLFSFLESLSIQMD